MNIDLKHRINLQGFTEQDSPYQCPDCNETLEVKDMLGFGEYPKGGFRQSMKPNKDFGVGFECPKCFLKSVFHADKFTYQMFKDTLKIQALEKKRHLK